MEETVLQGAIPSTAELCCTVAEIDLTETQDSSAKSNFHWKTFKCRLILDNMRYSVIACPVYETLGSIHVITSVEFFKSQFFQNKLREMKIMWSSPRPVTPDVYANCLRYSIYFAIAPRWNRVGQYLIAGKNFLMRTEHNIAMRFKLILETTNESKMNAIVKIQPLKIKQCYLSLEDIDIPHEVIAQFMADPEGKIDVASFGNHRVTVLPSLKKGKLMAVFKTIPASSPFENYKQLRRHWKNMYGYRLPESDIEIIYYDVYFAMPSAHRFLYPDICVRSRLIFTAYPGNREALVRSFSEDINETVTTICGKSLKFIKKNHNIGNSTIKSSIGYRRGGSNDGNNNPDELDATPHDDEILQKSSENFDESTARLSFSSRYIPNNQQLARDHSSLMSPTPSLRGYVPNAANETEMATNKLRGILVTSAATAVGRSGDTKSTALREPRTMLRDDNYHQGSENFSPNATQIERSLAQEHKSTLMEIEAGVSHDRSSPNIFMPISSFAAGSQATNVIAPIFVPLKFQEESPSATDVNNQQSITNYDVVSKYFVTKRGSNDTLTDDKIFKKRY